MEDKLHIRGIWVEDDKENFTDQVYPILSVNIPTVDVLLKNPNVLGEIQSNVFAGGVRFIKSFYNKDSLNPQVIVSNGKLAYLDEIKLGIFEHEKDFPSFSFTFEDISPILSFLDQNKNQLIIINEFKDGYALETVDGSVLVYAFKISNKVTDLDMDLKDPSLIKFGIEVKKLLMNLQLLKTSSSQLFDELGVIINSSGYMALKREPNFESKLSINPISLPDEDVNIKVQFSNLIHVLRAFQDYVEISLDTDGRKMHINGDLDITINDGSSDGALLKTSCKGKNILSYWDK